eukprot:TRINITY_DN1752_c0_g1_i3.p1 TRINITY_DN1752_c0_g1~~TRINITY_DN1752_c0_g1_i3.p1  ORF type:complete len:223 (+),score=43.39 TRINITY_DN1752_c0_g1_i3:205-873(+)
MLMNYQYLPLFLFWFIGNNDCSKGPVDCSDIKGERVKMQSWDCNTDGSIECNEVVKDCMSCEETGFQESGTATHAADGTSSSLGGGWDCRSKCRPGAKQGPSGTQQWVTFKRCFGSGSGPKEKEVLTKSSIDCSDMKGEKIKKQTWKCNNDGSAECTEVVEDCMSCEKTGIQYVGTKTHMANGAVFSVGKGWDCRSKCEPGAKQGPSGTQQWADFKRCFGSG